jgi:hypothetical protein
MKIVFGASRAQVVPELMLAVIFLLSGLTACRPQKQSHSEAKKETSPASFAGCYVVKLGRWLPWGFSGEGKDGFFLVTPPSRIQLSLEQGTKGFERDYLLIRPIKGTAPGRGGPSYWLVQSNGQVDLIWNDGFTGVALELEKYADELRGWAHPHFDAPTFIARTARVTAQRISCVGQ